MEREPEFGPEAASQHQHPAALPDDALLTTRELAHWLGRSESNLEVCRSRGRGFPYVRLPDGGIRYRVGTIREILAGLDIFLGTHQYVTTAVAGPGRPRRTRSEEQKP